MIRFLIVIYDICYQIYLVTLSNEMDIMIISMSFLTQYGQRQF